MIPTEPDGLQKLQNENRVLRETNDALKIELDFLKLHPVFAAGIRGEALICNLLNGKLTSYAESFDVTAGDSKLEVKYSALGTPVKGSPTLRWSWSKVLGWKDKGKNYDFLVLVGEKDRRFPDQYKDDTPYVCFLIPRADVESLMFKGAAIGGIIQITSNFSKVQNIQGRKLLNYMVCIEDIPGLIAQAGAKFASSRRG